MFASDLIEKRKANMIYANLLLQKQQVSQGKSIRVIYQNGGTDYSYMSDVTEGAINTSPDEVNVILGQSNSGITIVRQNGPIPRDLVGFTLADFSGISDQGTSVSGSLDDAIVPIPTNNYDFYFFGTNYGNQNSIFLNSNNAIIFGSITNGQIQVSQDIASGSGIPAVLLGNYDRRLDCLDTSYYSASGRYTVIQFQFTYENYFTDNPLTYSGIMRVRLIRESTGLNRQWIEVTVISTPPASGYSDAGYFPTGNYPSGDDGSGQPIDSNGNTIDPTKLSPYNITDGNVFINPCGTAYTTAPPSAGTTFVFQSNDTGFNWTFSDNSYVNTQ